MAPYVEFRYFKGKAEKRHPKGGVDGSWRIAWVNELGETDRDTLTVETETEAMAIARELERRAERVRLNLEEAAPEPILLRDAWELFRKAHVAGLESVGELESRWRLHILPVLGDKLLSRVTPADIQELLTNMKRQRLPRKTGPNPAKMKTDTKKGYSEQTRKHVRTTLHTFFDWCIHSKKLLRPSTPNPVDAVPEVVVPKQQPVVLEPWEVEAALAMAPEEDRGIVATGIFTGGRKGELCGLKVTDVHLEEGFLVYRRSYSKATTKGKKEREVPIPPMLVPYLQVELGRVRSEWLFPKRDGSGRKRSFDAVGMFRKALVKAGVVQGYDFKCRRRGCGYLERRADDAVFPCPKCGFMLWVVPVPKPYKFKDLRSTYATLLGEVSGDGRAVQGALGHVDFSTTERYLKVRLRHLQAQAAKLAQVFTATPTGLPRTAHPPLLQATSSDTASENPSASDDLEERARRDSNPQLLASKASPTPWNHEAFGGSGRQPVATTTAGAAVAWRPVVVEGIVRQDVPPAWLPRPEPLEAAERLLSSREVAELLGGVTLAAVSYHVKRGALPALREAGQLRFRRADVEAFLARRGGGT